MKRSLDAATPCDVMVVTRGDGRRSCRCAVTWSRRQCARSVACRTGIAVRIGEPIPAIGDGASLRVALLSASRLYFPDPQRATAGIHFAKVLRGLAIDDEVADRLSHLSVGRRGDAGAGRLRAGRADRLHAGDRNPLHSRRSARGRAAARRSISATVYAAGITARARDVALATRFLSLLAGPDAKAMRERRVFCRSKRIGQCQPPPSAPSPQPYRKKPHERQRAVAGTGMHAAPQILFENATG